MILSEKKKKKKIGKTLARWTYVFLKGINV